MSNFLAKTVLTADGLNGEFAKLAYRGVLAVSPKINGSATGVTGTFAGTFVTAFNAITTVQITLDFTSLGTGVGDLNIDVDGTNFFTSGTNSAQSINITNVRGLSGTVHPRDTPLFGIIQGKSIRILASQYATTTNRVLNQGDLTSVSHLELAGTFISY